MLKHNRPYSCENDHMDIIDKMLISDMSLEDAARVNNWIAKNITMYRLSFRPVERCNKDSYSLKHLLERETDLYLTNNQFKDAMLLAGFEPIDPNELNWRFKNIVLFRDLAESLRTMNPFLKYISENAAEVNSFTGIEPEDVLKFFDDAVSDSDFPVIASYRQILRYLYDWASEKSIECFERAWGGFVASGAVCDDSGRTE